MKTLLLSPTPLLPSLFLLLSACLAACSTVTEPVETQEEPTKKILKTVIKNAPDFSTIQYRTSTDTVFVELTDKTLDTALLDVWVYRAFHSYPEMRQRFNQIAPTYRELLVRTDATLATALAYGNFIIVNSNYIKAHPEDAGVMTHESFHNVQWYPASTPKWITEGLADYARHTYGSFNDGWRLEPPKDGEHYSQGYKPAARFFLWLEKRVQAGILEKLDKSARENTYSPDFWKQQTSKTTDELWSLYRVLS